jgi:ectoine hydroxylase-related dioxygenase (phytanoyl-CoA dioxygenase family)
MQFLEKQGYQIASQALPSTTVDTLLTLIQANPKNTAFGVREFLPNNPGVITTLANSAEFRQLLASILPDAVCVRSIYFDKPPKANWVVGWHQDLTMNLNEAPKGNDWQNIRVTKNRVVGQPPIRLLEVMVTVRIHLDKTDNTNGALRVVPGSHLRGIFRTDAPEFGEETTSAVECNVERGGMMLMKPLTLHASRRTTRLATNRRVIHLEMMNRDEVEDLNLQEKIVL